MGNRSLSGSPIVAALLSLLFPGLGQAAAGDRRRGLIVAIPILAILAALALLLVFARDSLFGLTLNQGWLTSLLILDLVAFIYHGWAIVDSYLLARKGQPEKRRIKGAGKKWAPVLGVALVMAGAVGAHGAFAQVDMGWQHDLYCLTAPTPCWVTDNPGASDTSQPTDPGVISEVDTGSPVPLPTGSEGPLATFNPIDFPPYQPRTDAENWAQDGQLNVVLIGVGVENNPSQVGPDTVMAVHIELATGRTIMVSVGRTYTCVPLPASWSHFANPASNGCPAHSYPSQLWNLENDALANCRNFPILTSTCGQSPDPNKYLRATEVEETAIGMLVGWQIDGSVTMNPVGLIKLIDDMGGVNINVKSTVTDYPCGPAGTPQAKWRVCDLCPNCAVGSPNKVHYGYEIPEKALGAAQAKAAISKMIADSASSGGKQKVSGVGGADVQFTIKPGQQHMDGDWALAYARSRIYYTEFDRQGRQQEVLKALRQSVNPCDIVGNAGGWLSALADVPYAFNTDLPINNIQDVKQWASLASRVGGDGVQKLVLTPKLGNNGGNLNITNWASGGKYPMIDQNVINQVRQLEAQGLSASPTAGASASASGGGAGC
jgi:anionic cell wall polymer biosynthesis LytR-Cps2A-Psr (LCP) family protein